MDAACFTVSAFPAARRLPGPFLPSPPPAERAGEKPGRRAPAGPRSPSESGADVNFLYCSIIEPGVGAARSQESARKEALRGLEPPGSRTVCSSEKGTCGAAAAPERAQVEIAREQGLDVVGPEEMLLFLGLPQPGLPAPQAIQGALEPWARGECQPQLSSVQ